MKKVLALVIALTMTLNFVSAQKKVSILGDSYSTYSGHVYPAANLCFYRDKSKFPNDVHDVRKTWWWLLNEKMGYVMVKNNSYSGATICNTGYGKNDYSDRSFVTRMTNIGEPDILFIFGGTNDCWAKSPLGEYMYEGWTKKDLYKFRPAFCYLLHNLKAKHPNMKIINICNSDLDGEYNSSMAVICKHYGVTNVQLKSIDKQYNHPSIVGMEQICKQLMENLEHNMTKQHN